MGEYLIHMNADGILKFIINRPEKRNAVSYEVMDGLEKALEESVHNDHVKALVITGSGDRAFCSGVIYHNFTISKQKQRVMACLVKWVDFLRGLLFCRNLQSLSLMGLRLAVDVKSLLRVTLELRKQTRNWEIGRASCRERV